ncbi:MAG: Gfo/Idh/MocA family oxidoreductase [Planctomycetota bacterium]|nr:Gfo/Idh/MocA family oxidoreductase [Planctomycetota bacterium]
MSHRLTRRSFLQSGAIAGIGLPLIRTNAFASENDQLQIGCIGVGGKGWSDMMETAKSPHVTIQAICDIDDGPKHLGRAAEQFPKATRYSDWRVLLDKEKLDAVIVSTPDHMHAPIALSAIERGLHAYCQKPLTHTVHEARVLASAAKKAGVVTQMGNQIQAYAEYRTAVQLVHDGAIGKVKEVFSWQAGSPGWPRAIDRPAGSDPIPRGLKWENWLGVAPERPYKAEIYHPFNWRGWQDFSNGQLGDFGCHILDPVFMALGLAAPTSITADAPAMNSETWTKSARVKYVFPGNDRTTGSSINVTWIDGEGHKPAQELAGIIDESKLPNAGSVLIGESGSLLIPHVSAPKLFPEEKFADYELPKLERLSHYVLWADACRGEGKTHSHFSYAGNLTETILLGTIAIRLRGTALNWNAAAQELTGHAQAADLLSKPYRKGWEVAGLT